MHVSTNVSVRVLEERVSKHDILHAPTMAIPSIIDGQSDRKPVSSELHKIILAKVQKGYNLLLKKDQISIFCENAYLQIISFITTKFHEILLNGFSGVVLTNCFE